MLLPDSVFCNLSFNVWVVELCRAHPKMCLFHFDFVQKQSIEMRSNSCNSSMWPQMWPQAKSNLVTVPPESNSLVTQVGFAGPCGQVGHTGQNQMCCICCSRCPCNLPFRQLCNPGSYLQGTVSPLLIPKQLWWKSGPQELSSSNLSQADSGRLKWCLTIPLFNTS